jgi:multidrug resistance efflux pump
LAAILAAAARTDERPWLRTLNKFLAEKIVRRRRLLVPLLAITALAMFLPIRYRVPCECQLQPVARRVISAPFAGTLELSLVKPGDVVRRGDTLGRMDGREIRWDLAGLIADQRRAAKNRDVNMADNKVAVAQMDALEMQRLDVKRRLLADRAAHLDIKSPIDGVVISGDLKRAEGAPVAIGQTLYEIAPLDRMVAEVAIPDDEISRVRLAQSVTINLDA